MTLTSYGKDHSKSNTFVPMSANYFYGNRYLYTRMQEKWNKIADAFYYMNKIGSMSFIENILFKLNTQDMIVYLNSDRKLINS